MDAQGTMRLMFDTMDAYDRADFDRLAEIYAEDAQWRSADPNGPHCRNRDDIFRMFRQRMRAGIRIQFDELRSTPTQVLVTARAADFGAVGQRVQLPGTTPATDRAVVAPGVAALAATSTGLIQAVLSPAASPRCWPAARYRESLWRRS